MTSDNTEDSPNTNNEENMPDDHNENKLSLNDCLALLDEAHNEVARANNQVSEVLHLIVANHGKSFTSEDGTLHQIRVRKGAPYLVTLKEEPKVYLKRARDNAARALLAKMQEDGTLGDLIAPAPVTPVDAEVMVEPLDAAEAAEAANLAEDDDSLEVVLQ
jgi:hypothetical protein